MKTLHVPIYQDLCQGVQNHTIDIVGLMANRKHTHKSIGIKTSSPVLPRVYMHKKPFKELAASRNQTPPRS